MEIFGILSGIFFNVSAVGLAYKIWRYGHAREVANTFLLPWMLGCSTGLVYAIYLGDMPLILNFGLGSFCSGIIFKYKFFERSN